MSTESAGQSVNGWNADYLDEMYAIWQANPGGIEPAWQRFFEGFELGASRGPSSPSIDVDGGSSDVAFTRQGRVDSLIYHYRDIGHLAARLDPLGSERPFPGGLTLESFDLSEKDLDDVFDPGHLPLGGPKPLREIIDWLRATYCGHIGVEYMHIQDRERRRWLQQNMEPIRNRPEFSSDEKHRVLRRLIEADGFESFLDTRYKGKKRFGLEGGEALIPALREIVNAGPAFGVEEYTIGMAHRGRLNVLVNVLQKTYDQIFTEFEEAWTEDFIEGGGDVKYHRGYSSNFETPDGNMVRLTLSPNPSHLEFGHAVVLGRARAKQRLRNDTSRNQCVPILIHGDASFPGQGIVAEMFNMMKLDGYTVGGALHIVVNNQIGFTTNPSDAHSGTYCTDIAKVVEAPIFHVNGDDPEAMVYIARLAIEYREKFNSDVVIDMWCYRKYGHNEGDEPTFTQPQMYERIRKQTPVLRQYAKRLIDEGHLDQQTFDEIYESKREALDAAQTRSRENPTDPNVDAFRSVWAGLTEDYSDDPVETGVERDTLVRVSRALGETPEDFALHRKLKKLHAYRATAIEDGQGIDWGLGEMLAYGTLLLEGHPVRLTGQDVERGTFSHRHAVVFDQETAEGYTPLNHIAAEQNRFCIHNSPLTESACVGFEYGYSLGDPRMLILWEAQFGDFANGAQVFFDQFIASAEAKWERCTGLTCLLPHGYEGQGPEHSSARLERFLALCAKENMQVAYPTTPAQIFHILRRQMKRQFRKPLIIMSPKSLLRHPSAISTADELINGRFEHVIDDPMVQNPSRVRRLLLCSGKVYYDLLAKREDVSDDTVAIVRVEQLYPYPLARMTSIFDTYRAAEDIIWVQEEPKNMGAFRYIEPKVREHHAIMMSYIGREESASPAVASQKMHTREQDTIVASAIDGTVRDAAISAARVAS